MKKIITLLSLLIYSFTLLYGQDVALQRTSDLMPELYSIEGQAFLEELSDGSLVLRLSEDFTTPGGPDVRILLSNSLSLSGAEEIINLSTISHFNGARTFAVPASIDIEDFDRILFFCVNFQQFWASGSFGDVVDLNGGTPICEESTVQISDGSSAADICPTDEVDDEISFSNSLGSVGSNYAYLITDENDVLQEVVNGENYNFSGSIATTQRVHGIHFDGTLQPLIGSNRTATTATDCFIHSANNGFVTITKTGACISDFQCEESLTATTDWAVTADVCPTDAEDDFVALRNNLFIPPGEHYAYLITDANEILQEVIFDSLYNFSGSSTEVQRVYGIHYDGTINAAIGENRLQTTASECFIHSGGNLFLTVNKTGACISDFQCEESLTATTDWAITTELCPTDNTDDIIELRNNLFISPGDHYAYLITDENEILQEVVFDSLYNFSGSSIEVQRVYGIHYDGTIDAAIGENRLQTTASECFIHSGGNLFLTINKTGACENTTSTNDTFLSNAIAVFPNPSDGRFSINYNNVEVEKVQLFGSTGKLVQEYSNVNQLDVLNSGIYFIRFITEDSSATKRIVVR